MTKEKLTVEQALALLKNKDAHGLPHGYTSGVAEAIDMATQALESEKDYSGCHQCKWADKQEWEEPCTRCKHSHRSYFEWKEEVG